MANRLTAGVSVSLRGERGTLLQFSQPCTTEAEALDYALRALQARKNALLRVPPQTPGFVNGATVTREGCRLHGLDVELWQGKGEVPVSQTGEPCGVTMDATVWSVSGDVTQPLEWSTDPETLASPEMVAQAPRCGCCGTPLLTGRAECAFAESEGVTFAPVPDVTARVRADVERVQAQGFNAAALREFAGTPTGRLLRDVLEGDRDAA